MQSKRHEKIIELIEKYDIETQDELADRLVLEGYQVTQATVSRDIRKLKLSKVPGKGGRQKYALLNREEHQMADKYVGILREAFVSMDCAQNILVIKNRLRDGHGSGSGTGQYRLEGDRRLHRRGRYRHVRDPHGRGYGKRNEGTGKDRKKTEVKKCCFIYM